MYSTKQNVQQLTSLMLKAGITKVVVCPGSRNIPLVHNFVVSGMQCYEVTDERSAGFFALGLIESNGGKTVAVCCTSGSAVLNLAPAVSEAFYRPLPLLVITADRPQRWIGQMDGQTMIQPGAFTNFVRKTVSLPEDDRWFCNRLINEAFIEQTKTKGPVHINVPINEPFFDFSQESLPDERLISYYEPQPLEVLNDSMSDVLRECKCPMIVVGQLLPEELGQYSELLIGLAKQGYTIVAEQLSNLQTIPSAYDYFHFDIDERLRQKEGIPVPDLVVTMGGHIVSKRLKQFLRVNPPRVHWHISPTGELSDLFMCATQLIKSDYVNALTMLMLENTQKEYILNNVELPIEAHILQPLFNAISDDWTIHVANSTMVRTLIRYFRGRNAVYCNRGINGIEGSLSTAVGYWAGSGAPTIILTGDLSFFYDKNALWNNFVKSPQAPLRIVILNNGCGDIFHHLPGLASPALDTYIAARHNTTAEGIAMESGARYIAVRNEEELTASLPDFMNFDCCVSILEIIE